MNELEINRIIEILKPSGLLTLINDSTKEEISHKLFDNKNDRKEILRWLISQFSDNYHADIQNSQDIDLELVRKLSVLGYVEHSTKWLFIKGEMGKEDQMKIYNKIFRSLELLKSNYETQSLEENKENSSILKGDIVYDKLICGPIKGDYRNSKFVDFDLAKAKVTLEKSDAILASIRKRRQEALERKENVGSVNGEAFSSAKVNLDSLRNAFKSASTSLCEKQNSLSGNPCPVKLDAVVVGELHGSLQLMNKVISPTKESMVSTVDSKKTLLGIEDIKKSLIFKIN